MGRYNYYYYKKNKHNNNQQHHENMQNQEINNQVERDLEQQVVHQENNYQQFGQTKNKKTVLSILGIAILVISLVGLTYAFFNYTRTGSANTIRVGKITFNSSQGQAINMTNMFPIDVSEGIPNDATKVGSVTINITGDTTYDDGIEYLVSAVDVSNTVNSKKLPISIDVSVTSNGEPGSETTLGTADADYFTNRSTTNSSIYKVLAESTINTNDRLMVGYIKKGATGVDGNIVVRAYLDDRKIAVSDTYDGTESDNMGTTSSWVNNRTVFTTTEWNSLQTNGVSFKVKVEANEGIWVEELVTLYNILADEAVLDNANSTYVQNVGTDDVKDAKVSFLNNVEEQGKVIKLSAGIDFSRGSSDTNGKGLYIKSGTENTAHPIYYYRGQIYNNNVVFGGFCWLAVRTTETGGVKLIYNGLLDEDGTCMPLANETSGEVSGEVSQEVSGEASGEVGGGVRRTGTQTLISVNDENKFTFADSILDLSYAGIGYMRGTTYYYSASSMYNANHKYGTGFQYDDGVYTLVDADSGISSTRRYTCRNSTGVCNGNIYYVFNQSSQYIYYMVLNNGRSIEAAVSEMTTNTVDSNIKSIVDTWYASNLSEYTSKLEDTVWCNDRSLKSYETLRFNSVERFSKTVDLSCRNKNDAFTVDDEVSGNGALTYPVGLLTIDELSLSGLAAYEYGFVNRSYLSSWVDYSTMTPVGHAGASPCVFTYNDWGIISSGGATNENIDKRGIRPAVSLKYGTAIANNGADGTAGNPYVIE